MADLGYDYDLFVIGAGSGGVRAARIAAQSGAKVAIAEEFRIGGTCVIRGCVPKKFMVYASDYGRKIEEARDYGWNVEASGFDFPKFMSNMHAEVDRLSGIYLRNLANAGVDVFEERAEMQDANTVILKQSGKTFSVDKILIAAGGTPWRPGPEELPGVEHTITSNEIFSLETLPRHIVIAGGGYIACEFAHVFAGLGVETCLVYRGDTVLNGFDWDVRTAVHEGLKEAGVRVITQAVFDRIEEVEGAECPYEVSLGNGTKLNADVVMMAVGRRAATEGLGCDRAGVRLDGKGAVIVDDASRTSIPNIFAVGDVASTDPNRSSARNEGHEVVSHNIRCFLQSKPHAMKPMTSLPIYRWGSVFGPQKEGLRVYFANGWALTFWPWLTEWLLFRLIVGKILFRGIRDFNPSYFRSSRP